MTMKKAAGVAALALVGYDTLVRPWMLCWGASSDEQQMQLPGDEIASGVPAHEGGGRGQLSHGDALLVALAHGCAVAGSPPGAVAPQVPLVPAMVLIEDDRSHSREVGTAYWRKIFVIVDNL